MREENYPNWKREIIKKYLHYFSCKLNSDKVFDRFIYYAEIYMQFYEYPASGPDSAEREVPQAV